MSAVDVEAFNKAIAARNRCRDELLVLHRLSGPGLNVVMTTLISAVSDLDGAVAELIHACASAIAAEK